MRLTLQQGLHGIFALVISSLIIGCETDDDMQTEASYQVSVTNITNGQPLTPLAVMLHNENYSPWELTQTASAGIEMLAESGSPDMLLSEANSSSYVYETASTTAPFGPGETASVTVNVDHSSGLQISIATMLANTNDAFSSISNWPIAELAVGESTSALARVYDAGTESNDEANIPGPAAGGEGYNVNRDDIDKITVHAGVVSMDDGLATSSLGEEHRWQTYAAKITISRLQ